MYTIGEELRSRRQKRHCSLDEAAEITGVSDDYLRKLETGSFARGVFQRLHAVSIFYGISPFRILSSLWLDATGETLIKQRKRSPLSSTKKENS